MAVRQAAAESSDRAVVFGKLLAQRQRIAGFGLRRRRLARLLQHSGEHTVVVRQILAELDDGGVVVDELS